MRIPKYSREASTLGGVERLESAVPDAYRKPQISAKLECNAHNQQLRRKAFTAAISGHCVTSLRKELTP
jgi:hypothetical protein